MPTFWPPPSPHSFNLPTEHGDLTNMVRAQSDFGARQGLHGSDSSIDRYRAHFLGASFDKGARPFLELWDLANPTPNVPSVRADIEPYKPRVDPNEYLRPLGIPFPHSSTSRPESFFRSTSTMATLSEPGATKTLLSGVN